MKTYFVEEKTITTIIMKKSTAARRKTGIPSHLSSVMVRSHMTTEKTLSSCANSYISNHATHFDTQIFGVFSIIFYVNKYERTQRI